jgi:hypothetical protein
VSAVGIALNPDATIQLAAGDTVTCTFENTQRGHIEIIKNTVNGNGVFPFTTTGGNGLSNFSLDTGLVNTDTTGLIEVKPGPYTVTEGALPLGNWSFTSLSCQASAGSSGAQDGIDPKKANISVIPGGVVTCTYVNTLQVDLEACSPGYWKQPQHFGSYPWQLDPYGLLTPSQQVVPVDYSGFDATLYGSIFANAPGELAGLTFPAVIGLGGGGIFALGRQSAAAYLNAVVLDGYFYSPAEVVSLTNAAFLSGDYQSAQSLFSDLLIDENCTLGYRSCGFYRKVEW